MEGWFRRGRRNASQFAHIPARQFDTTEIRELQGHFFNKVTIHVDSTSRTGVCAKDTKSVNWKCITYPWDEKTLTVVYHDRDGAGLGHILEESFQRLTVRPEHSCKVPRGDDYRVVCTSVCSLLGTCYSLSCRTHTCAGDDRERGETRVIKRFTGSLDNGDTLFRRKMVCFPHGTAYQDADVGFGNAYNVFLQCFEVCTKRVRVKNRKYKEQVILTKVFIIG